MHSALLTAAMLALGAAHQVQAAAYIPERVGTAVVSMQPALVSTIKKYRYQPFCIAYLKCAPPSAQDPTTTRTISVATPTAVTIGGAAAMSIVEDPDLTIQGRITEVRNIPIATEYTTSTTSLTVGKFTQTNTVLKTVTAAPKMVKKRGSTPTEEDRALAKRQAASCPALPQYLQKGENYFSDSEWVWIVENACAAAIPTALPAPTTRTQTFIVGDAVTYELAAPTTTWTIPGARIIEGTDTSTVYYTQTDVVHTYEAVFSYTTVTKTATTTVRP